MLSSGCLASYVVGKVHQYLIQCNEAESGLAKAGAQAWLSDCKSLEFLFFCFWIGPDPVLFQYWVRVREARGWLHSAFLFFGIGVCSILFKKNVHEAIL